MEEKIRTVSQLFANHFSVQLDTVRLRTGRTTERIKINHPQAAAIVPFVDDRQILMVRQWRYAIDRETLEIPAGKVDPGEELEACARRELTEETGYTAQHLLPVFRYYPAIGYSDEVIQIYAASGLKRLTREVDSDEIARVEQVELEELHELIMQGIIQDGKTVIGVSLFRTMQEHKQVPWDFFR